VDGGSGFFEAIVDELYVVTSNKIISLKLDFDVALLGCKERSFVRVDDTQVGIPYLRNSPVR
jgi:hypothetical protein